MADVFVNSGEDFVIDQIDAFGTYFIGWGSGAGVTAKADTTLFTEETEARQATVDTQPASDTINWNATLTADGAKTITNAGVFDALAVGTMVVKGDFTGIALALGDKIEFDISLQMT